VIVRYLGLLIVFLGAAFPVDAFAKTVRADIAPESLVFKTDERDWQVGFQNQAGNQAIAQFVLPGESVKEWTDMITINTFSGLTEEDIIKKYSEFSRKTIVEKCREVDWKVIAENKDSSLYVWTAKGCGGWPDQSEVVRALRGKQGLYIMHYGSRTLPLPLSRRDEWIKLFENADLVEDRPIKND
jgi:hypothetical protein